MWTVRLSSGGGRCSGAAAGRAARGAHVPGRLKRLRGEPQVRERHGEQHVAPHRARLPAVQRARAHLQHHLMLAHLRARRVILILRRHVLVLAHLRDHREIFTLPRHDLMLAHLRARAG